MTFSIDNVLNSLAGVLKEKYPDYPVYISPNQQGTEYPCFFLFLMPSTISAEVDGRFYRDLGIDVVFVQARNIVNGYDEIQVIQEYLDCTLEMFPYTDGSAAPVLIHTYERQASVEDDELHYQFHIRQRVSLPKTHNPMEEMEENNVGIKEDSTGKTSGQAG